MKNLFCPFCAELLLIMQASAKCLRCESAYTLVLENGCLKELKVVTCGKECVCGKG